jgi:hypothetical protein
VFTFVNVAMNVIGAKNANFKPSGYGLNHIVVETFADEATNALRKF